MLHAGRAAEFSILCLVCVSFCLSLVLATISWREASSAKDSRTLRVDRERETSASDLGAEQGPVPIPPVRSERTPVVVDCRSHQVYADVPLSPPPFVGSGRLLVPVIARHEDTCGTMHSSRAMYVVLQTNVLQTFARCRCCCQSASCPMVNQSAEHRQTDSSEPAKLGPKRPSPAGARRTNGAFQDQPCLNTRGRSAQLARI